MSFFSNGQLSPNEINTLVRFCCFVIAMVFYFLSEHYKRYNPVYHWLQLFLLCMGLWNAAYVGYLLSPNAKEIAFFNSLIFVFNSFAGIFYFMFALQFSFPSSRYKLFPLFFIPCCTALLSVTYPLQGLMFTYGYVILDGIPRIPESYGPWYYVHLTYSYLIVLGGIVCMVVKLLKKSTPNKRTVCIILLGNLFLIVWNFIGTVIFPSMPLSPVFSGFFHLLCIITIYIGVISDNIEKMISIVTEKKDDLFPVPIFITDIHGILVYSSSRASTLLIQHGFRIYNDINFDAILQDFTRTDLPKHLPGITQDSTLSDFFLLEDNQTSIIYYIEVRPVICKRTGKQMGTSYFFNNITQINLLLSSLEKFAFRDMLTGAYNRHFFEMRKDIFAETDYSNFSLVMCDIDNLKLVNDTYGHTAGDDYIVSCCKTIFSSIRKKDFVFRMGGDEFLILLPDTNEPAARIIVDRIQNNICTNSLLSNAGFVTGISMGVASVIEDQPINFPELIEQADRDMYLVKTARKMTVCGDVSFPDII